MNKSCLLPLLLLTVLPIAARAQFADEPAKASGACSPQTSVAYEGKSYPLACTQVTVMVSEQGKVLLQFTDDQERGIAFQGRIEGSQDLGADTDQHVVLDRLYMGGKAYHVASGTCVMHWTDRYKLGGKLTAADCDANAEAGPTKIKALAALH